MTNENPENQSLTSHAHQLEQLLVVRYLFREGVRALDSKLPYGPSLAVSLFQDCVELLLTIVAVAVDARVTPTMAFLAYWDVILNAPLNPSRRAVPFRAAMTRMNAARVAFKHHGNLVLSNAAAGFRVQTEEFLRDATSEFLSLDIDEISLVNLVVNESVKMHVREASKLFDEAKYKESVVESAIAAFELSRVAAGAILPEVDWELRHSARHAVSDYTESPRLGNVIERIAMQLEAQRRAILLLISRTDPETYARFMSLIPDIAKTDAGTYRHEWVSRRAAAGIEPNAGDAKFCFDYVIDYALKLQAP